MHFLTFLFLDKKVKRTQLSYERIHSGNFVTTDDFSFTVLYFDTRCIQPSIKHSYHTNRQLNIPIIRTDNYPKRSLSKLASPSL